MRATIKSELERLAALPQSGWFTLLHHNGSLVEYSDNLAERVQFIMKRKPARERLTRLRNIYRLSDEEVEEYLEIRQTAWAEYKRVEQLALEEYRRAEDRAWEEFECAKRDALEKRAGQPSMQDYDRIRQEALEKYDSTRLDALQDYEHIERPARHEYNCASVKWLKATVPFTTWNGQSIFSDEGA